MDLKIRISTIAVIFYIKKTQEDEVSLMLGMLRKQVATLGTQGQLTKHMDAVNKTDSQ